MRARGGVRAWRRAWRSVCRGGSRSHDTIDILGLSVTYRYKPLYVAHMARSIFWASPSHTVTRRYDLSVTYRYIPLHTVTCGSHDAIDLLGLPWQAKGREKGTDRLDETQARKVEIGGVGGEDLRRVGEG